MKIGVFDSGLGGLTVIRSIIAKIPEAELVYLADTAYAPYGDKSAEEIRDRSLKIAKYFIALHQVDTLVVACNSATSAAIKTLRDEYPGIPIVGTEPGIKPAFAATKSAKIGVMATSATLAGEKYQQLADKLTQDKMEIELFEQSCPGLVEHIERGKLDSQESRAMLQKWLQPMKDAGVDTIVLGCTHYPIAAKQIKEIMGKETVLIETGDAIANRIKELLTNGDTKTKPILSLYATSKIDNEIAGRILERAVKFEEIKI